MPIPLQTEAEADSARRAHLDELLDEALRETFPASDPIAVSIPDAKPEHSSTKKTTED